MHSFVFLVTLLSFTDALRLKLVIFFSWVKLSILREINRKELRPLLFFLASCFIDSLAIKILEFSSSLFSVILFYVLFKF